MLLKLSKLDLDRLSEITLHSLDLALHFVFDHNLQSYVTQMQYIMYLTGYFVFNKSIANNTNSIINWIKTISFTNKSNGEKREIFDSLINNIWNID